MPGGLFHLLVIVMGGVVFALGFAALRMIRRGGAAEEIAAEAQRDRETARQQAEIMLQERTPDETADRLDDGRF